MKMEGLYAAVGAADGSVAGFSYQYAATHMWAWLACFAGCLLQ
jgi:hypothetical protein